MKGKSQSHIPSFESLPYLNREYNFNDQQLLFIISRKEFDSHQSIQNNVAENQLLSFKKSSVSIQVSSQEIQNQKKLQDNVKTEGTLKGPHNKKNGGCVCKKTGCLKLYCQCFRKGTMCGEDCSCVNCFNLAQNKQYVEDTRLIRKRKSRNSFGRSYCNCKKSQCQKKYCQCFNSGLKCAMQCRCEGCSNVNH